MRLTSNRTAGLWLVLRSLEAQQLALGNCQLLSALFYVAGSFFTNSSGG